MALFVVAFHLILLQLGNIHIRILHEFMLSLGAAKAIHLVVVLHRIVQIIVGQFHAAGRVYICRQLSHSDGRLNSGLLLSGGSSPSSVPCCTKAGRRPKRLWID